MTSTKCKQCGKAATDDSPMKRCPCKLKDAVYCDQTCQTADWNNHKKACREAHAGGRLVPVGGGISGSTATDTPSAVKAVELTGGWNVPFHPAEVDISSEHVMFKGAGYLSPISQLIGQPILVYRHLQDDPLGYLSHPLREHLDNQSVTYLMIDPESGFAPARWQCGVGQVTVARQDKTPLAKLDLEKIWMFCDRIIGYFGNGDGPPRQDYNPVAYAKFVRKYKARTNDTWVELDDDDIDDLTHLM